MIGKAFSLFCAVVVLCAARTEADGPKIERNLKKEPAYVGKPRYLLLSFGPEARTCIWCVLDIDGRRLYVDRNQNGDITEPGKRFVLGTNSPIQVGDIRDDDG